MVFARALGPFLALALSAGAASATVYECEMVTTSGDGNWMPQVVVVDYDKAAARATVYDPLIKYFNGKPLAAKVETDNDNRVSFTWKLKTKDARNTAATMSYRLTVRKADLSATVSGKVLNFDNGAMRNDGRCKVSK